MHLFTFTANCFCRAVFQTDQASGTFFRIDTIGQEWAAYFRRAFLMDDMGYIFIPEVFNGCQYWIGRCLTQSAQRVIFDLVGKVFQLFDIPFFSQTAGDPVEYLEHPHGSQPAEGTLSA